MDLNQLPQDGAHEWKGELRKDKKLICQVKCCNLPFDLPYVLDIQDTPNYYSSLSSSPFVLFHPVGSQNERNIYEWGRFLEFLHAYHKVAIIHASEWQLAVLPPKVRPCSNQEPVFVCYYPSSKFHFPPDGDVLDSPRSVDLKPTTLASRQNVESLPLNSIKYNFAQTHPSYLETLSHTHGWIFGALAELIDNARDAKATRVDISIDEGSLPGVEKPIPILCVTDNGTGMTHEEVLGMVSFGHKRPVEDDVNMIGRFGVGFKTGSMRLGKDVVVLTQSQETRSIAFLSSSYNKEKNVVEIPICTYRKRAGRMDFDLDVQTQAQAEANLESVKNHSPFNEYKIGESFGKFGEDGTGTQIYIYNLDRWGSDYSLQWDKKSRNTSASKEKRDIMIRSKRMRTRPGQMSKDVPLDYSLHAFLEYMFLDPRMKIYVQGTRVRTRPLAKLLNNTQVIKETLLGKEVILTLGRNQEERDRGNCGIFLYWHGRLIEAYKRVGGMVHNPDMGRGIIGVIETTNIMDFGNGNVKVLNNKQGFQDCEAYAELEKWLGQKADEYWDTHYDTLAVHQKEDEFGYDPDLDWVQCNKCLKWRMLQPEWGVNSDDLPEEWFCYMPPFKGSCKDLEEKVDGNIITVGTRRSTGLTIVKQVKPVEALARKNHVRFIVKDEPTDDSDVTLAEPNHNTFKRLVKTSMQNKSDGTVTCSKKPRR